MPSNFITSLKQPFYLAGRRVDAVRFNIGRGYTKIVLNRSLDEVDAEGAVNIALTPQQAREIAWDMLANADKDQLQMKVGGRNG
jgi:hypothetical protein